MKTFVHSIAASFPPTLKSVQDDPRLSAEEKKLYKDMGYDQFYLGDQAHDAVDLMVDSSKSVLQQMGSESQQIDMALVTQVGNVRMYVEWPTASYILKQLGIKTGTGVMLNSMCTSIPLSMAFARGLMATQPNIETALIMAGSSWFAPHHEVFYGSDVAKYRAVVTGAGGVSLLYSRKEGPVEILEAPIGDSYTEGDSWTVPFEVDFFEYQNGKSSKGKSTRFNWPDHPTLKDKEYISPGKIVLQKVTQKVVEAIHKHGLKEMYLSCIPIGETKIEKFVEKLAGIPITPTNEMYQKYGHVTACDPGIAIHEALRKNQRGVHCHIAIGQGYTGTFFMFKI